MSSPDCAPSFTLSIEPVDESTSSSVFPGMSVGFESVYCSFNPAHTSNEKCIQIVQMMHSADKYCWALRLQVSPSASLQWKSSQQITIYHLYSRPCHFNAISTFVVNTQWTYRTPQDLSMTMHPAEESAATSAPSMVA